MLSKSLHEKPEEREEQLPCLADQLQPETERLVRLIKKSSDPERALELAYQIMEQWLKRKITRAAPALSKGIRPW